MVLCVHVCCLPNHHFHAYLEVEEVRRGAKKHDQYSTNQGQRQLAMTMRGNSLNNGRRGWAYVSAGMNGFSWLQASKYHTIRSAEEVQEPQSCETNTLLEHCR
jgi:hypothetical protein